MKTEVREFFGNRRSFEANEEVMEEKATSRVLVDNHQK